MTFDFSNQSVLVTGATAGIGEAVAITFAQAGANVMLSGRDQARGQSVLANITKTGGNAELMTGDISDVGFCEKLITKTKTQFGSLDVLVNNAGVIYYKTVADTTDDEWNQIMSVNVNGVFYCSRAAVRLMQEQGRGNIVNIASDASLVGFRNMAAYCASKGAVLQLTKAMALDHAREGIRVNAVCPDNVDTPMFQRAANKSNDKAKYYAKADDAIPIGRIAQPEDVTNAVLYLASEQASFLTGVGLPVDGGVTAA